MQEMTTGGISPFLNLTEKFFQKLCRFSEISRILLISTAVRNKSGLAVKDGNQDMTNLRKPLVLLSNANDLRNKATRKARKAHPRNLFVLINNEPIQGRAA